LRVGPGGVFCGGGHLQVAPLLHEPGETPTWIRLRNEEERGLG